MIRLNEAQQNPTPTIYALFQPLLPQTPRQPLSFTFPSNALDYAEQMANAAVDGKIPSLSTRGMHP